MAVAYLKHGDLMYVVDNPPDTEDAEYYYEEKLCPHDVLNNLSAVIDLVDLDDDAHGIFEYLGQTEQFDIDFVKNWKQAD